MKYGYIRISTDKQTTENQRFEIINFSKLKQFSIEEWIEETISSTKRLEIRKFGHYYSGCKKVTYLSCQNFRVLVVISCR